MHPEPIDPVHPDPALIQKAAACLRSGQLVIVPTDTVYGLAGLESAQGALEKIFEAKARPFNKKIPRLASSLEQIHSHGAVLTETFHRLADVFWPGPLTMVLRHERQGDMAYRIPDHAVARQLIEASGEPLLVTSANLSGQPDSGEAWEAARSLGGSVAMVLDAGPCHHMVPSTVVSLLEPKLTVLREGAIREAELLAALR